MNRNVHSFNQIENINQLGKMIIELKGKCYNATIAIERYDTRCPWCSDHESINIIEQVRFFSNFSNLYAFRKIIKIR